MSELSEMIRVNKAFLNYVKKLKSADTDYAITEEQAAIGEKIIVQRSTVFSVFLIESGLAKCYLTEDTGNDFIQEFFGEGEIFGEVEMITKEFSFCTIEALTPTTYLKIPKDTFQILLQTDSQFNVFVLKLLATKIRYTALRHSYNQSHPLEDNLIRLLEELPDLFQKISKSDIANYLGITTRSLNRAIKNLGH